MPKATLASRPVKNKDTGLDLTVTSFRETKGMVTSTVYYQVVLVSNLACFKTPSHRESDVVQYTVEKKLNEFEQLRAKVAELYPSTMLPPINKKAIIVNDAVLRERRNSLNALLKFFASTPNISICAPVLEFLGVDSLRAKRFSRGESVEGTTAVSTGGAGMDDEAEANTPELSFLGEEDENAEGNNDDDDDDLFNEKDVDDDADMFTSKGQVQMFEEQDLKRELTEDDEKDFGFIPDAIITKREKVTVAADDEGEEDHSELFQIEDDLDELMKIDVSKKKVEKEETESVRQSSEAPETTARTAALKPSVPSKPKPSAKPKLPEKPSQKPSNSLSTNTTEKPTPAPRPKPAPRTKIGGGENSGSSGNAISSQTQSSTSAGVTAADTAANLGQDDILKYLQDNLAQDEEEVDLFS
ncbi:HCLS1-binding protein 3 [Aplysia californica]|uniref:HCLS1-binding protein 3 n=1 Tax=Aplysia californica TaxID=6500 RepID=A0ABM0JIS0_APLCA|nr:HCLS1-binding protein 3 [Aplysia californica]